MQKENQGLESTKDHKLSKGRLLRQYWNGRGSLGYSDIHGK